MAGPKHEKHEKAYGVTAAHCWLKTAAYCWLMTAAHCWLLTAALGGLCFWL